MSFSFEPLSWATSDAFAEMARDWPQDGLELDQIERLTAEYIAQNEQATDTIDPDTGYMLTKVAVLNGVVVGWERVQITDRTCFVLNHWVAPEYRKTGVYDKMRRAGQHHLFSVMTGIEGVMFQIPKDSKAALDDMKRKGYTLFQKDCGNGFSLFGYTREWFEKHGGKNL